MTDDGERQPEERARSGHGASAPEGPRRGRGRAPPHRRAEAAIAEARTVREAKGAEREILHRAALDKARSYEEIAKLNQELAQDRERIARDRDGKIAKIRDRPG